MSFTLGRVSIGQKSIFISFAVHTLSINPEKLFTNGLRLLHNEEKAAFTSGTVCQPKEMEEDIENKKWSFQLTLAKVSF